MIKIDYTNMMIQGGISDNDISANVKLCNKAFEAVQGNRGLDMQGWMDLPYCQTDVVKDITATAEYIKQNYEYFVVLGIGGSALGNIALFSALKHIYHNELPRIMRGVPKFYVIDNADPDKMLALFDVIDVNKTMFNIITKSGATSETMSQYLIVNELLNRMLGENASKHIIATTSADKGNLIKLAKENNYKTFVIPDGVGGRFSVLSPVGLLSCAVLNIDINELLRGAMDMDKACNNSETTNNPALLTALLQYLSVKMGRNISVMMPYAESLRYISDWYCQLWGESLGKATDKSGKTINAGQTPVKALGVTDQHSQIQLYVEGPNDKVITFIEVEKFHKDVTIPQGCQEYANVNFLCGHSLGELMRTELYATKYALTSAKRMNYTIIMPRVDEYNLGQLLYYFMMQTAYMGVMLNIDTYNQPGVEGGKNATYALFGRQGYGELADKIKLTKSKVYIV